MENPKSQANGNQANRFESDDVGHPVGVGLGAVGGGAVAGAVGGAIAGPVGVAIGAAAGAVAGGMAGKVVAESIDPDKENKHWQDNFAGRPYIDSSSKYDEYAPAYRYGWENYGRHGTDTSWDSVENDLSRGWDKFKGKSDLNRERAKHAVKDAWDRISSGAHRATGSRKF